MSLPGMSLSREWLLSELDRDPLLRRVHERVRGGDGDAAHDIEHLLRVALKTLELYREAAPLTANTLRVCVCAALLHDVVNLPKNHPERASASRRSAEVARELLRADLADDDLQLIAGAIEDHSFSLGRRPRSRLGEALQDADRLEALGALGIARTFSTGARLGSAYLDPDDPWAERRPLNDRAFSIDHFFSKLLKLPSTFCTPLGRVEAQRRARVLKDFLRALADEIGTPIPAERLDSE